MAKNKKTFEDALNELEDIVEKLEKGNVSLEEAISLFERGIELSKYCNNKIDEAEKRITMLLKDEKGNIIEQDVSQLQ